MGYRLTLKAQSDLETIVDYISDRNAAAAVKLAKRFMQQWEILATQPYSGQACDDVLPGLRRLVMAEYVAFHRVHGNDVLVLRIVHGKRDITSDDLTD